MIRYYFIELIVNIKSTKSSWYHSYINHKHIYIIKYSSVFTLDITNGKIIFEKKDERRNTKCKTKENEKEGN